MTMAANPFVDLVPGTTERLDASDRFPAAGHLWSRPEIDALIFAWAARRPLLVRGEAGSGKSQIARAAGRILGDQQPLTEVIHPRFDALDLLYRVDAVERLTDAQLGSLDRSNERYVRRGKFWEAMARCDDDGMVAVLLIDEIDKADADVPNALLDVLGNRSFSVPPLGDSIVSAGERMPLVVITTNEERELPAAFVRRCAVLNLSPPEDREPFIAWLVERGRVHAHLDVAEAARQEAARQVRTDREAAVAAGYPPVGLAEYIDLLTALHELSLHSRGKAKAEEQRRWLGRIAPYALVKNAGQRQSPADDAPPPAAPEATGEGA